MLFVYINVIMICECKSKAFYLHIIYLHDIPLKLTIVKGIILREATLLCFLNRIKKFQLYQK